jgi:hypothetical protein
MGYGGGLFWAYWCLRVFPSLVDIPSLTKLIGAQVFLLLEFFESLFWR